MKKLLALSILFLLHLVALAAGGETLAFWTKPLLMPALALWFFLQADKVPQRLKIPILFALFCSMLGDTALLFADRKGMEYCFLLGIGFFLVAHIFYIITFVRIVPLRKGFLKQKPELLLPVLLYLFSLLALLWESLAVENLQVPVAVYGTVISLMLLSVINLKNYISDTVFRILFFGALLFILSDSLIAISKFLTKSDAGLAIMVTYLLGQFLLVYGVLKIKNRAIIG